MVVVRIFVFTICYILSLLHICQWSYVLWISNDYKSGMWRIYNRQWITAAKIYTFLYITFLLSCYILRVSYSCCMETVRVHPCFSTRYVFSNNDFLFSLGQVVNRNCYTQCNGVIYQCSYCISRQLSHLKISCCFEVAV